MAIVAATCIVSVGVGHHAVVRPKQSADGPPRRRRWLRRTVSLASVTVALVAVGVLGYPLFTNMYAQWVQSRLEKELTSADLAQAYATCRTDGVAADACSIDEGDSLTRIIIPAIDVDVVVVEGVGSSALRAGAGHYPSTPLPCEPGNVAIAGHRTTYGRPFHDLDLLQPGDEIILRVPIGECRYLVTGTTIVRPDDIGVVAPTMDPRLTLTTCHPENSARERLVVSAQLASPLVATTA
jgi:sortase A